jgi:type II secretory pathway pseudopilin PulG
MRPLLVVLLLLVMLLLLLAPLWHASVQWQRQNNLAQLEWVLSWMGMEQSEADMQCEQRR